MPLTVINVGYPFAPVSADPVGGAEQVLAHLDRALIAAGHRSIVVAPEGSSPVGDLVAVPAVRGEIDERQRTFIHSEVRERLARLLDRERAAIVHLHGLDFDSYLPPPGPPVLVTLHLPLSWYASLGLARPRTWLHPVSASQAATAPPGCALSAPLENGVRIPSCSAGKRRFALALGRICAEKGFEDALDASAQAGIPFLIAGSVFPYPEHESYFRTRIAPRLDRARRYLGPVSGQRKRSLLARARCVLVPSRARETSSLVAMEALAAGTPVVAYPSGALRDIVGHGRTGYLVGDPAGMAEAMLAADCIDPEACRREARKRFTVERMTAAYLRRYQEIASA